MVVFNVYWTSKVSQLIRLKAHHSQHQYLISVVQHVQLPHSGNVYRHSRSSEYRHFVAVGTMINEPEDIWVTPCSKRRRCGPPR